MRIVRITYDIAYEDRAEGAPKTERTLRNLLKKTLDPVLGIELLPVPKPTLRRVAPVVGFASALSLEMSLAANVSRILLVEKQYLRARPTDPAAHVVRRLRRRGTCRVAWSQPQGIFWENVMRPIAAARRSSRKPDSAA